jgi:hypothetical protein
MWVIKDEKGLVREADRRDWLAWVTLRICHWALRPSLVSEHSPHRSKVDKHVQDMCWNKTLLYLHQFLKANVTEKLCKAGTTSKIILHVKVPQ